MFKATTLLIASLLFATTGFGAHATATVSVTIPPLTAVRVEGNVSLLGTTDVVVVRNTGGHRRSPNQLVSLEQQRPASAELPAAGWVTIDDDGGASQRVADHGAVTYEIWSF